jgi:threonine/homoserine/homoserine lactone efflux protein
VFSGDDWALIVVAALGAAYLVWLSVGLIRGQIQSGLAGDLIELDGN